MRASAAGRGRPGRDTLQPIDTRRNRPPARPAGLDLGLEIDARLPHFMRA